MMLTCHAESANYSLTDHIDYSMTGKVCQGSILVLTFCQKDIRELSHVAQPPTFYAFFMTMDSTLSATDSAISMHSSK